MARRGRLGMCDPSGIGAWPTALGSRRTAKGPGRAARGAMGEEAGEIRALEPEVSVPRPDS